MPGLIHGTGRCRQSARHQFSAQLRNEGVGRQAGVAFDVAPMPTIQFRQLKSVTSS
jgi:hypothetical protein